MRCVWLVGQYVQGQQWHLQGIYTTEKAAIDACVLDTYFVVQVATDASLPPEHMGGMGWYPKRETRHECAVRGGLYKILPQHMGFSNGAASNGSLWDERKHARKTDSRGSHEAAAKVAPHAMDQCARVLDILQAGPLRSREAVRRALAVGVCNLHARVSDLRIKGGHDIEVREGVYYYNGRMTAEQHAAFLQEREDKKNAAK